MLDKAMLDKAMLDKAMPGNGKEGKGETDKQKYVVDFLLHEYENHRAWAMRNEELGEKRVDFFIAVITAIVAVFALKEKGILPGSNEADWIFFYGFIAILLFGIFTLKRIITRNLTTSRELRAMGRIRKYFADIDSKIEEKYLTYKALDDEPVRKKKWEEIYSLGNAGLAETVAFINSLIVMVLFALLALSYQSHILFHQSYILGLLCLLGFMVWIIQFVYIKDAYEKKSPKPEDIKYPGKREIEAALIILSERPEEVAGKIASITTIANRYTLLPPDSRTIHDVYFDTQEKTLQAQNLALRVREVGANYWLTFKGPSRLTDWGGTERLEIEEPWSEHAVMNVVTELAKRGIKVVHQHQGIDYSSPLTSMSNLGLQVVQDRESHRTIRNIILAGGVVDQVLAELAVDSVMYRFDGRNVRLYEVEIEAKTVNGSIVVREVIENLFQMFGSVLLSWDHSKLATGKAIEKMLREGSLKELLDDDYNLKPGAYHKIDSYLKRDCI